MKLARSPAWHWFQLGVVWLRFRYGFSYQLGNQDILFTFLLIDHWSDTIWSLLPHSISSQTPTTIIVSPRWTLAGCTLITNSHYNCLAMFMLTQITRPDPCENTVCLCTHFVTHLFVRPTIASDLLPHFITYALHRTKLTPWLRSQPLSSSSVWKLTFPLLTDHLAIVYSPLPSWSLITLKVICDTYLLARAILQLCEIEMECKMCRLVVQWRWLGGLQCWHGMAL